MRAFVNGSSALFFLRRHTRGNSMLESIAYEPLSDCPSSSEELKRLGLQACLFGVPPIRLMVCRAEERFMRKTFNYTIPHFKLPWDSFIQVDEHACVARPELCLLQAFSAYSAPGFLELCMEFCGTYALIKEKQRGFITRDFQLATVDSLSDFARRCHSYKINRDIVPLFKYIAEGANSPMETREYLLMCLPKKMGGYGLPKASLNMQINLSEEEQFIAQCKYFKADMCWPDRKVIIEYDGHEDHESLNDRAYDARRRNILVQKGYTVFTMTGQQVCNAKVFDSVVRDVAHALGHRLKGFPENWPERRDGLRGELFKTMGDYDESWVC